MSDETEDLLHRLAGQIAHLTEVILELKKLLWSVMLVPVTITIVGSATYVFMQSKITEGTWLSLVFVALFPFYGEGIKQVLGWAGIRSSRAETAAKLVILACLLTCSFASTGCAALRAYNSQVGARQLGVDSKGCLSYRVEYR